MIFKLQSLNDVVTNSSSDKSCDDLFTVSINYEDMLESYFEDILDKSDIDEIHLDTIEEIRCHKDNTGHFISDSEAYAELVKIGLVGNMIPTRDFESDWRYPTTEVSIIPKGEAEHSDIAILNKINDLFCVEACYN